MSEKLILEIVVLATSMIMNICGLWIFAWFRINKKFKKEASENWRQAFERYWFEIVATAVIVPQWPDMIKAAAKLFAGAG